MVRSSARYTLILLYADIPQRHEHLYEKLQGRFIRSDELFADAVDAERMLGSSSVILCTISMLSNPAIDNCGIFRLIPVERLIVDEASQIDTFEFMVSTASCPVYTHRSCVMCLTVAPLPQVPQAGEGVHVRGPETT